jgi:hypothetical protein
LRVFAALVLPPVLDRAMSAPKVKNSILSRQTIILEWAGISHPPTRYGSI